jgi:NAD(P)H dehydrogenase (quinone)
VFVIFGANGKAGSVTARRLLAKGREVTAVVRDVTKGRDLAALGCEIAIADLRDADAVAAALEAATAAQVICPVSPRSEHATAEMTAVVDGVCAALARTRVPRVVAISDYGAELTDDTGITRIFHRFENQLRALPAELTLLRSAEHMQNWSRLIPSASKTGILPSLHHPITKKFPTVSATDVGEIAADLLMAPSGSPVPRVVHVEGPRRYTTNDVASALTAILGRSVIARELPRSDWTAALTSGGLSTDYATLVTTMFDVHNAGRIDAEPNVGEILRGKTELHEVLATLANRPLLV